MNITRALGNAIARLCRFLRAIGGPMSGVRNSLTPEFNALIERSQAFQNTLIDEYESLEVPGPHRLQAAYGSCGVAFAHGAGIQLLLLYGNNAAAMALVRLQFEALVRANWLAYAAPEGWIESFFADLVPGQTEEHGEPFPRVDEMLDRTVAASSLGVVRSLHGLKASAWNAMNSYTHGGQRQISRYLGKYDPEMLIEVLKTSNGLNWMAAKSLVEILEHRAAVPRLLEIHASFKDCLHAAPGRDPAD